MACRSKEHPLYPLGDPFYTRLSGTLIPGCWAGGRWALLLEFRGRETCGGVRRGSRSMQSTQLLLVPGSVTPSLSSFSPALTDLAALLSFPPSRFTLNSPRPLYPFSVPSGHLRPTLHLQSSHFPWCLSFSVSALLLSSALLTEFRRHPCLFR